MTGLSELKGELMLPPLPDYLTEGLTVVFIGFNPGERSAQTGFHYAYPGNRFWWLLWQAGFTPTLYRPEQDAQLPALGYGLTNIVARPSRSSSDLSGSELRSGREELLEKLWRIRPTAACYNGKGVYAAASGVANPDYGLHKSSLVDGTLDFVAASPSGRSRERLATKLRLYQELKTLVMP